MNDANEAKTMLISRLHFTCLINRQNYRNALEVGVFEGKYATYLLENCPQLSITLVDAWDGTGMSIPYQPELVYSKVISIQEEYGRHRVQIVRESSPMAVMSPQIENRLFDFIYIDADHSFDAVVKDIQAWWPKLRIGGVLAGHDYNNRGSKRVKKAVDSIFKHVNITQDRCASWWIFKKDTRLV